MIPKRHPARKRGSQRTGNQRREAKKNQFAALAVENVVTSIEMMEDEEVPTQIERSVKELGVTIERNNTRIAPHQPQCATPSASEMEGASQLGINTGVEVSSPLVNSQVPPEVNFNSVDPNPKCNIADPSSNSVNTTNEGNTGTLPVGQDSNHPPISPSVKLNTRDERTEDPTCFAPNPVNPQSNNRASVDHDPLTSPAKPVKKGNPNAGGSLETNRLKHHSRSPRHHRLGGLENGRKSHGDASSRR
ncbi:hypothetical protein LINGRAHAP2_LOCUS10452 [Linum grandiflorum]